MPRPRPGGRRDLPDKSATSPPAPRYVRRGLSSWSSSNPTSPGRGTCRRSDVGSSPRPSRWHRPRSSPRAAVRRNQRRAIPPPPRRPRPPPRRPRRPPGRLCRPPPRPRTRRFLRPPPPPHRFACRPRTRPPCPPAKASPTAHPETTPPAEPACPPCHREKGSRICPPAKANRTCPPVKAYRTAVRRPPASRATRHHRQVAPESTGTPAFRRRRSCRRCSIEPIEHDVGQHAADHDSGHVRAVRFPAPVGG